MDLIKMPKYKTRVKKNQQNLGKWVSGGIGALFIFSILWSMWVDTLRPLLRSGDTAGFINNIIGLPIILLATAVIIYGGYRVIKATMSVFGSEQMQENMAIIHGRGEKTAVSQARRQNALGFFRAWANGGAIMLLGFGLMALGGWLINR